MNICFVKKIMVGFLMCMALNVVFAVTCPANYEASAERVVPLNHVTAFNSAKLKLRYVTCHYMYGTLDYEKNYTNFLPVENNKKLAGAWRLLDRHYYACDPAGKGVQDCPFAQVLPN